MLRDEVNDYYGHFRVTPDLIELRNLLESADLIVRSALHRKESRGLHYTLDYPETLPGGRHDPGPLKSRRPPRNRDERLGFP
jgi:succinate dehydrogenase/fumarate reductase flavoprotein subunit